MTSTPAFSVEDRYHTLVFVTPHTEEVRRWLERNRPDGAQWYNGALTVVPCHAKALIPTLERLFA